eukprot:6491002-Amphidinium_carterae.4
MASRRLRQLKEACQGVITQDLAWDVDVRYGNIWCGSGKLVIGKSDSYELNMQHAQTVCGGDDAKLESLKAAFGTVLSSEPQS